jgi:beta-glucanase (GH16 family)
MGKWLAGALCALGFLAAGIISSAATHAQTAAAAKTVTHETKRETLVWSDDFNSTTTRARPNPANWNYETGGNGWGNHELETYCAYGSNTPPCDAAQPNAFVGRDGYLHIVARSLGHGVYTSARLTTEGLRSFQYGRIEARIEIPRGQGMWPAFWMLGDDIAAVRWPACGEFDIMENIGKTPDTIYGSIHGAGFTGHIITNLYSLPNHAPFADGFHTYGILWSPNEVQFYVDSPSNVYATETPADLPSGAVWPFNKGRFFILLNLAVGGAWPGNPNASTKFPQQMLVDYVRVYQEQPAR